MLCRDSAPHLGVSPKNEFFFDRIVTSSQIDSRCKNLHGDRGDRPLRVRKISMGFGGFFTEIGDFFEFFDVPKRCNFDPFQSTRTKNSQYTSF